ncbi:MAG: alkaline phosphatase D family protein [Gammaproteobacteria bacterium]|nr:alkaline phosphatase D family protein [Gammaproteobacteria bacterium]MDH3805386.1 alkaline phosphatase D family protein [Gammaproteobacteria bacterium]
MSLVLLMATASAAELKPEVAVYVSHGPVLGRLGAGSVGVWTRTAQPAAFHVRYGTNERALDSRSATVATVLEHDNTAWVKLESLLPDTVYYYQVAVDTVAGVDSDIFHFRSLPSAKQKVGQLNPDGLFNFAFSAMSCAKQSPTMSQGATQHATLFRDAADNIDFHVVLGDWIYEQDRRFEPSRWLNESAPPGTAMPPLLQIVPSLAGAWQNYKTYYDNDPDLKLWHATVPSIFIFDDHEVLNNFQDATVPGHTARNALFRDPALRAWRDYLGWSNPTTDINKIQFGRTQLEAGSALLTDPAADFRKLALHEGRSLHVHWGGPDAGYRNSDAENRSEISAAIEEAGPIDPNASVYAIEQVVGDNQLELEPAPAHDSDSSYSIGGLDYFFDQQFANAEFIGLDTRSRRRSQLISDEPTMLGESQKDWLLRRLKESEADVVFVLSSVSFVIPHLSEGPSGIDDQSWTGYTRERDELLKAFESSGKTVILLTGDLHNAFSIQISERIWEFSVGPIGSLNRATGRLDGTGIPSNGPYSSAGLNTTVRWSTHFLADTARQSRRMPVYAIVQMNNVFNSPDTKGNSRWVAFEKPQVVVQFYNASTGRLLFAESVLVETPVSGRR